MCLVIWCFFIKNFICYTLWKDNLIYKEVVEFSCICVKNVELGGSDPANIYLSKVNDRNTRIKCEICQS